MQGRHISNNIRS